MLITSHKPEYVEAIKTGSKTCLLLSKTPKRGCQPGDWQAIWTTSPMSAIECVVRVKDFHTLEYRTFDGVIYASGKSMSIHPFTDNLGLSFDAACDFIARSPSPCAVWIDRVELIDEAQVIPLRGTKDRMGLEGEWAGPRKGNLWRPPQTLRYLNPHQVADLVIWTDGRTHMAKERSE